MPATIPIVENIPLHEETFDFSDENGNIRTSSLANLKKKQLSSSYLPPDLQKAARNSLPSRQNSSLSYPRRFSNESSFIIQRNQFVRPESYNNSPYPMPPSSEPSPHTRSQSQSQPSNYASDMARLENESIYSMANLSNYLSSDALNSSTNVKDHLLSIPSRYPFLTALHSFQSSSLPSSSRRHHRSSFRGYEGNDEGNDEGNEESDDEDPASTCLSFQKDDTVILHSLDTSGWGDATLLLTGQRGWIPTNYFQVINHNSLNHLMSSILRFVIVPKSQPINRRGEEIEDEKTKENDDDEDNIEYTFSQQEISSIISGVRSFLKSCGALTREPMLLQVSKPTRKYRKALLAELAILVSLTKQNKGSYDDRVIEKLVLRSYKILARAVYFLAVISTERKRLGIPAEESDDKVTELNQSRSVGKTQFEEPDNHYHHHTETETINNKNLRLSTTYHTTTPFANARLLEVNRIMIAYLSSFISKIPSLNSDIENRSEILHSTRLCVRASRELISVIESIMSRDKEHENASLDLAKDNLYTQTMSLISMVRDIMPQLPKSKISQSASSSSLDSQSSVEADQCEPKLELDRFREQIQVYKNFGTYASSQVTIPTGSSGADLDRIRIIATECMDSTSDCVSKCERILAITGDFQLETTRLYPIFASGEAPAEAVNYKSETHHNYQPQEKTGQKLDDDNQGYYKSPNGNSNLFEENEELDLSLPTIDELNSETPCQIGRTSSASNCDRNKSLPNVPADEIDKFAGNDFSQGSIVATKESLNMVSLDERVIMDSNGVVHGASMEGLIRLLADPVKSQDAFFVSTFFISFRQFTTPLELTTLLIDTFNGIGKKESLDQRENVRGIYLKQRILVYNIFKRWLESHWNPYEDLSVLETIKTFGLCELHQELPNAAAAFLNLIDKVEQNTHGFLPSDSSSSASQGLTSVVNYKQIVVKYVTKPQIPSGDISKLIRPADISRNQLNLLHRALVVSATNSHTGGSTDRETIFAGQSSKFLSSTPTLTSTVTQVDPVEVSVDNQNTNNNGDSSFTNDEDLVTPTSASFGNNWGNSFRHALTSSAFSSTTSLVTNASINGSPSALLSVLDFDAKEIARQITLMDSTLFCEIQPSELVDTHFSIKKRHLKLAVNVNAMTAFSNQVGAFVGDSILNRDLTSTKLRRNYLKQWIKIGHECLGLNNLNGAFTILAALQSVTIIRLRKTWELLAPKHLHLFKHLKSVFDSDKNFSNYRQYLAAVKSPLCIPYLGIHLTDLTFIEEGNPPLRSYFNQDFKTGNRPSSLEPTETTSQAVESSSSSPLGGPAIQVINFDKYCRTARIIGQIQQYQVDYGVSLTPVLELQQWLRAEMRKSHGLVGKDLNGLWRRSCLLEPRVVQNSLNKNGR